MGGCGCGDFCYDEAYKFGKNVLALQVYQGCEYCSTPIGVVLHLMTPAEAKEWDVKAEEEFKMDEFGYAEIALPMIHPANLVAAAKSEEFEALCGKFDLADYDSLADLLEDCALPLLQVALDMTVTERKKNKRANPGG